MGDLRSFLEKLRGAGELIDVREPLSPLHEIPFAIRQVDQTRGSAVLFHRVKGSAHRVIGNLLGRRKRLALALGVPEGKLRETYLSRREKPIPPRIVPDGPVQEVVIGEDLDLRRDLPVLTHHAKDAGPYITCGVTVAKDPETGLRGMGIHRIQVKDRKTIGIFLATPPLSSFLQKAAQADRPLEIAVVIGPDPLTFFSSVIWAPAGIDKFELASGLRQEPLPLVKARSVDLEVPAEAEFVLEGRVFPYRRETEGPFGESSGYYFSNPSPVGEIHLLTHRLNPIYQALMPFCSEELVLLGVSRELDQLQELKKKFPSARQVYFKGLMGLITVVQIKKEAESDGPEVIRSLFAHPSSKFVVVVDEDVDPEDARQVEWAAATRVNPERDLLIETGWPGLTIDPSVGGKGAKVGIDATKPLREADRFERIDVPEEAKARVRAVLEKGTG